MILFYSHTVPYICVAMQLRPRLAAKRRKLDHAKRVDSEELAHSVRNTQTT